MYPPRVSSSLLGVGEADAPLKDAGPPATRPLRWYVPLAVLVVISLALVATSYLLPSLGHPIYAHDGAIGGWFNVDTEGNVPSWWSTMLLGGAGIGHLWGAWVARATRSRGVVAWVIVALLLLAMSLDEAASLHETLEELRGLIAVPVDFEYFWLVIGIPLALAILAVVVVSGLQMPLRSLVVLVLGFLFLFGGAVGVEMVGSGQAARGSGAQVTVSYHREEALEMTGASLIAVAPLAGLVLPVGGGTALALGPRLGARRRAARAERAARVQP